MADPQKLRKEARSLDAVISIIRKGAALDAREVRYINDKYMTDLCTLHERVIDSAERREAKQNGEQ